MGYSLNSTTIRRPNEMVEERIDQYVEHRMLDNSVTRDYMGDHKRRWKLSYKDVPVSDFNTINSEYTSYIANGSPVTFACTDTNYSVSGSVHVSLEERGFSVNGDSYLCSFDLILTEA